MVITPDIPPYIHVLPTEWHAHRVAEVAMLRLDVIHKDVSGNKWYKLKYNIQYCIDNNISTILTFGGGYSNHLAATAVMAKLAGLNSIGIIRGQYFQSTPTLDFCMDNGMEIHAVAHEDYKKKNEAGFLAELSAKFPDAYIIPEGGANDLGQKGVSEIVPMIPAGYNYIAVSVGTGTTLAGILNAIPAGVNVEGFAPMKGGAYLKEDITAGLNGNKQQFELYDNWHFGGFGKHSHELIGFMNEFYRQTHIPLDKVYTAKMMFGISERIMNGHYPADARILCIHTGGLQGNLSIAEQLHY